MLLTRGVWPKMSVVDRLVNQRGARDRETLVVVTMRSGERYMLIAATLPIRDYANVRVVEAVMVRVESRVDAPDGAPNQACLIAAHACRRVVVAFYCRCQRCRVLIAGRLASPRRCAYDDVADLLMPRRGTRAHDA